MASEHNPREKFYAFIHRELEKLNDDERSWLAANLLNTSSKVAWYDFLLELREEKENEMLEAIKRRNEKLYE